jgi:hypothetical protein
MRSRLGLSAVLLLIALPTFAADRVIQSGIDPWRTPGNGKTFVDFSRNPIPAGFFCSKSAPFTGRVIFRGIPIVTGEPGALGKTDTIVQRLDDAVFDKNGVATTRVQMRALHLVSVEPIKTACGAYNVEVRLNGEQPITNMRIVRENEQGGRFFTPLAVNSKLVFTSTRGGSNEILEIADNVRFPINQGRPWAENAASNRSLRRTGFVKVDTDNDRVPDTFLPGTSVNFFAGASSQPRFGSRGPVTQLESACHWADTTQHCPDTVDPF